MDDQKTPLATHLIDCKYTPWKKNRKPLETRWQSTWEAFRGIVTGKWRNGEGTGWRSQSNINVTRQKVISAFAIIVQQVIRGGRIAYSISPDSGDPWLADTLGEDAEDRIEADAKRLQELTDEELAACDAERAYARNLLHSAVYGECYAKEGTLVAETTRWRPAMPEGITDLRGIDPNEMAWEPYIERRERFAWLAVSPWEIVRDLENDDLQGNGGFFHERPISAYDLRAKKGGLGFIDAAIDRVLSKTVEKVAGKTAEDADSSLTPGQRAIENRGNRIRYREFHGRAPTKLVEEFERSLTETPAGADPEQSDKPQTGSPENPEQDDGNEVECIIVLADDEIVRFVRQEPGRRPLERAVWEEAMDDLGGVGIAEAVEDIHRAMTGAFRTFEDMSKAASTLILVLREHLMVNSEDIAKGFQSGFLKLNLKAGPQSMSDAVQQFIIQNNGANVLPLMDLLKGFLEEASLVPQISAGIATKGEGDATAYEISTRVERAGTYIGMIVRNHDEGLTEPMVQRVVRRFFEDPDFQGPRGNFAVNAQGFAGFDQRNTKLGAIYRLLELALGNEVLTKRLKLDKPLAEIAATLDMEAGEVWRTDDEVAAQDQADMQAQAQAQAAAAAPQPEAPDAAAKADLTAAQAEKVRADNVREDERLKIDRAKAIKELEKQPEIPVAQK